MTETKVYDYLEPIEIFPGVYWIGFYDEKADFHCNPYLLLDGEEAVVFDPGSVQHYPIIASKIFSLVDPSQISHIVLHHQDPDLCGAVPLLEEVITNRELKLVTHSRAQLLIRYYDVKSDFYLADQQGYTLTLKSGRRLRFIKTPSCHFPASIVTYDEKEKLLFSSDIFGAVSGKNWDIFAKEGYEEKMRSFHEGYMASNFHLSSAIKLFEKLELEAILPQHGSVILKDRIPNCLEYLKALMCGTDLCGNDEELYGWIPKTTTPS